MFVFPVFLVSLVILWAATRAGSYWASRGGRQQEDDRADLDVILTASLALLGLIIGFTFSLATTRYNQRKDLEAAEANAIGTEYVRAGLLPVPDAERVRQLLKAYLDQRILFYMTRQSTQLQQIDARTAQLQKDLWSAVQVPALRDPNCVMALAVSGMNDALNAQAYTQAAYWNHIPFGAWVLMGAISLCCAALVGFAARHPQGRAGRFFLLPLILSIAFFLIADIDHPRTGIILVHPQNLESLAQSLR